MDRTASEAAPIACMLDRGDFRERLAWIADLNREALLGERRDDLRLELTYMAQSLVRVRELVRRERQCCAFLDFELRAEADRVRLVVTAPEAARAAADLVFEPFLSRGAAMPAASRRRSSGGAR
jgi:hypothetical protein